jgi:tRNA1(Val) A37 N6-methylase TrmN6
MLIKITPELDRLDIFAENREHTGILGFKTVQPKPIFVASLPNPVLITDLAAINRLDYRLRDLLFALYQSYPRTVEYDGVSVSWSPQKHPGVWGPSIDTIFLARGLKPYLKDAASVAELGTGSGFIVKYALRHASNLAKAAATDINIDAIRCASEALAAEPRRERVNFILQQPDSPLTGLNGRFDLIVSNPPYIPRPNAVNANPYEGLDLLYKLSRQAADVLTPNGKILLNISSLSGEEPLIWFKNAGWKVTDLSTMRVPLKVNNITNGISQESIDWLAYLKDHRDLGRATPEELESYPYWHTLRLILIEK